MADELASQEFSSLNELLGMARKMEVLLATMAERCGRPAAVVVCISREGFCHVMPRDVEFSFPKEMTIPLMTHKGPRDARMWRVNQEFDTISSAFVYQECAERCAQCGTEIGDGPCPLCEMADRVAQIEKTLGGC